MNFEWNRILIVNVFKIVKCQFTFRYLLGNRKELLNLFFKTKQQKPDAKIII